MSSKEWSNMKLGDIANVSSSKRIFANEYLKFGVPFYRSKEIIEKFNGNKVSTELFISSEKFKELKSKFGAPSNGDILLTSVGTLGIPYLVRDEEFYFKDGNLTWIKNFKQNCCYNEYLYYWFQSEFGRSQINSRCIGSTQKAITIDTLKKFDIFLPPIDEQKAIAHILSTLDEKIELNNQINKTLENMAQTIFKHWFIDFDPFEDGEFQDTELGPIPYGWHISTMGDVCQNVTDGVHNTVIDDPEGNYYLLSCKNIKRGTISIGSEERRINETTFKKLRKRTQLAKGDILLSSVGTVGEIALLTEDPMNIEFQRSVAIIKPNQRLVSSLFVYLTLMARKSEIKNVAHGAVQQCIFIGDIKRFKIIIPEYKPMKHYSDLVSPLFEQIAANNKKSITLISLRNTLLPKLMSSEIRVPLNEEGEIS